MNARGNKHTPELRVLYVDNHVLAVEKPAGLPTVPDDSKDVSLLDLSKEWIRREFRKPGNVFCGVVHRLDRPVSGVICFARTSKAASRLTQAFRERRTKKIYWGVSAAPPDAGGAARGELESRGELEQWLRKDRARNKSHVCAPTSEGAKQALTSWKLLETIHGAGNLERHLLELRPHTGRSHQLRIAAASLGAPLLGDLRYGADEPLPDKSIALHAFSIEFVHPTRDELLCFSCPAPSLDIWRFRAVSQAK